MKKVIDYLSNKSVTPFELKSNLVYKFNCHGCEATYIGETKRHLCSRIREHSLKSYDTSIYKHSIKCNSRLNKSINKDEFKIINNNLSNYQERVFCEALRIRLHNPILNVQQETNKLIKIY